MEYFTNYFASVLKSFDNYPHLHGHLNYLFRTDRQQKWTNEDTADNILVFMDGDNFAMQTCPEDLDERKAIKKKVADYLIKLGYANSRYYYVEADDHNLSWNSAMLDEMISILEYLKAVRPDLEMVLAVAHNDQPEIGCHFHIVFTVK